MDTTRELKSNSGELSNRKLRVKIHAVFSSKKDLIPGFGQGAVQGPMLLNACLMTRMISLWKLLSVFKFARKKFSNYFGNYVLLKTNAM